MLISKVRKSPDFILQQIIFYQQKQQKMSAGLRKVVNRDKCQQQGSPGFYPGQR